MTDRRARILLFLLLPSFLLAPVLLYFEWEKLHLPPTLSRTREERHDYYLQTAMPVLPDDYFALLRAAKERLASPPVSYRFFASPALDDRLYLLATNYAPYHLLPARRVKGGEEADFILSFRTPPPPGAGRVIAVIPGPKPSYITRTRP